MKTAVVTGATGFIGKAFSQYLLERGYKVYGVSRDVSKMKALCTNGLLPVEADFSQYPLLAKKISHADIFYHFAWDGPSGMKTSEPSIQLANAEAACSALLQAVMMGCKKFVLAGTVAEVEVLEHLDKNICHPRPACIYATAKLAAEVMCKVLAGQHGIAFNCGLFANIMGPGDTSKRSANSILSQFLKGQPPKLVKGEGLNDWLYIKDAVRLIEAMGERGVNMKTYYIGHTALWPLRTIIEKARDVVAPEMKLDFGVLPDSFLTDYSYISTTELYKDTGCKAEYNFEKSITETAEWIKESTRG